MLWRGAGESQVGVDPRCSVLLRGLTPAEQRVLEALVRAPTEADLLRLGRSAGVTPERVRELVAELEAAHVLDPRPRPAWPLVEPRPEVAYWSRLRPDGDGAAVLDARARASVGVLGLDRLGLTLAMALAGAGIGAVLAEDDALVKDADVGPYHPRDVGGRRAEQAVSHLRSVHPHVRTSAPAGARPDVVVVVATAVADPVRLANLRRAAVNHLPVVVGEVEVAVGPLVVPGRGPCTRCVDLHRTDADPAWPAVATQLLAAAPAPTEATLATLGAALAAHQVLAAVDGREVAVAGATLTVDALSPQPVVRVWSAHPDCTCETDAAPMRRRRGRRDAAAVSGTAGPDEHQRPDTSSAPGRRSSPKAAAGS
ncbi:thiamine biosynthesis protein ThiF [Georgenia ruanii]|uniref:Thiamine biosynthesis protein ThiF n=1 Tax=Georgenia ruanii TaxID=348442 RepID=A0A7J9V196_9MICO|nr:thiamine biosynthesis protein ThiF [Georgenia ruanii]